MMKKIFKGRVEIFCVSFLLFFTLCVMPPCELYFSNVNEFWFRFKDVLFTAIITGIIVCGIIFLIGQLLPFRIYKVYLSLLLGFILSAYIQGNFLNNDYGVFDGKEINWSSYTERGIISLILWIIGILSCFILIYKFNKYFQTVIKYFCVCLIIMQISGLFFLILNSDKKTNIQYAASTEKLFEFSEDKNIIILCLDAFDSNMFSEMLDASPEFRTTFADFTFYNNTSGMYPTTKASIPYILTGVAYENQTPFVNYIDAAYKESGLFDLLNESGFEYGIYDVMGAMSYNDSIMGKSINRMDNEAKISSYLKFCGLLYKTSLFKYLPHQLKPLFVMYTGEFDSLQDTSNIKNLTRFTESNFDFIDLMKKDNWTITKTKQFKFIHIMGMHTPYSMNTNMEPANDVTYNEQSIGVSNLVKEYLCKLKELGVYDNTCLFILADHGNSSSPYNCAPLFLVKEFQERGEILLTDSISISYAELQDIFKSQIKGEETVKTIIQSEVPQNRRFLFYNWDGDWNSEYMPPMEEIFITGDIHEKSNFTSSGNIYVSEVPELQLDQTFLFYGDNKAKDYFISGIGTEEDTQSWSSGHKMVMRFKTNVSKNIYVKMTYTETNGKQPLKITLGNMVLYEGELADNGTVFFIIPAEFIEKARGDVDVCFEYSDKVVIGQRAVAYSDLTFSLKPFDYEEIILDTHLKFDEVENAANKYFVTGLSNSDKEGLAWTDEKTVRMEFHTEADSNLVITFSYSSVLNGTQHISVLMDDISLLEKDIFSSEGNFNVTIPKEMIENAKGNIGIDILLPNAMSPAEMGKSTDTRTLGIRMSDVYVSAQKGN